jgi:hypothetical protein
VTRARRPIGLCIGVLQRWCLFYHLKVRGCC